MPARLVVFCAAACLCAAAIGVSAPAQDANSARQFVAGLYKLYATAESDGVPLDGPKARRYYHASLLALMRADERAARPDVGALDGDPVCSCQDWEGIWDLHVTVEMENVRRAVARVSFALKAPRNAMKNDRKRVVYTLVAENGAWRIWNIRDESDREPFGLREALQADIKMVKASHAGSKP